MNNSNEKNKFITIAKSIFGEAYDYSLVDYINSQTKVRIICPIHGIFEKKPNKHISSKQGCPVCGQLRGHMKRTQGLTEFIAKANVLHGDKYDYGLVEYINNHTKVIIGCPDHGTFEQIPNSHLNGAGCPHCAGNIRLDTDTFIGRALAIHGDVYDYSKVNYRSGRNYVTITCKDHGDFEQAPESHLIGQGCPKCAGNEKMTTESFIEQSRLVHGDKYDYSLVEYSGNKGKVKITCPEHGLFEQQAKAHMRRGQGCPYCANKAPITEEEFIKRARATHGDKYDYSELGYVGFKKDIAIRCKIHGIFKQLPEGHIGGYGCSICSYGQAGQKRKNTIEGFIEAATLIHGDTYDYSKSVYGDDNKSKFTIICREHGEFEQSPNSHLRGAGCPQCRLPSDNDAIYIWKAVGQYFNGEQLYKVGVTSSRLEDKRIIQVAKKFGVAHEITTLRAVPGSAQRLESRLMGIGFDPKFSGFDGATEFRAFTDADLTIALGIIQDYINIASTVIEAIDY